MITMCTKYKRTGGHHLLHVSIDGDELPMLTPGHGVVPSWVAPIHSELAILEFTSHPLPRITHLNVWGHASPGSNSYRSLLSLGKANPFSELNQGIYLPHAIHRQLVTQQLVSDLVTSSVYMLWPCGCLARSAVNFVGNGA